MTTNSVSKNRSQITNKRVTLLALGFCFVLSIFSAYMFWRQNQGNPAAVPPDFQLAAKVDLAARSYDGETVAQLSLAETSVVHIYYTLPNIDIAYFDLSLSGPNDDNLTILHSEDYRTDENGGGTWEQSLVPGAYQLKLTAPQTSGTLSVYWRYK